MIQWANCQKLSKILPNLTNNTNNVTYWKVATTFTSFYYQWKRWE